MRYSLRQKRLREQRATFWFVCGAALLYLVAGLPIVTRALSSDAEKTARSRLPSFATLDRNHDGYIDSSEAAAFPAYALVFSHADASGDGRLDGAEFAAARKRLERRP
jgi:hypothetical protein